jgi:hypothetical protein
MASLHRLPRLGALAACCVALAGCGGGGARPQATTAARPPATTTSPRRPAANPARDRYGTVWLCRPGLAANPCTADLTTTVVEPDGSTRVERAAPAADPPVDCFYVYPTISGEPTTNADLAIGFRQQAVAIAQASRFSQVCRVYAPVYRQITLRALDHPGRITLADALTAYRGVLAAFRDYLAHYNHGRGIVFIGHSQGAVILTRLLEREVDRNPPLRRRLVSALLLGGNVTVPRGGSRGGDFAHIPACRSSREYGCVVAYSSFTGTPSAAAEFGRTSSDAGVGLLAPRRVSPGLAVLCVNPAAPGGGSGLLEPYLPALVLDFLPSGSTLSIATPWVAFPRAYRARCESSGNATWLEISHVGRLRHGQPLLTRLQDPLLGLHILDLNIALGNLVGLVGDQAAAYRASHPGAQGSTTRR